MLLSSCAIGTKLRYYDAFRRRGLIATITAKVDTLVEVQRENSTLRLWLPKDTPVLEILEVAGG